MKKVITKKMEMVEIYNLFEYKYDFLIRLIKNLVAYDNSIPKPTKLTMYIMNLYSILSENFSENVISKTVIKLHKYNIIFEPNIAKIEKFHFSVENIIESIITRMRVSVPIKVYTIY